MSPPQRPSTEHCVASDGLWCRTDLATKDVHRGIMLTHGTVDRRRYGPIQCILRGRDKTAGRRIHLDILVVCHPIDRHPQFLAAIEPVSWTCAAARKSIGQSINISTRRVGIGSAGRPRTDPAQLATGGRMQRVRIRPEQHRPSGRVRPKLHGEVVQDVEVGRLLCARVLVVLLTAPDHPRCQSRQRPTVPSAGSWLRAASQTDLLAQLEPEDQAVQSLGDRPLQDLSRVRGIPRERKPGCRPSSARCCSSPRCVGISMPADIFIPPSVHGQPKYHLGLRSFGEREQRCPVRLVQALLVIRRRWALGATKSVGEVVVAAPACGADNPR